jgi:hypothetical protein
MWASEVERSVRAEVCLMSEGRDCQYAGREKSETILAANFIEADVWRDEG